MSTRNSLNLRRFFLRNGSYYTIETLIRLLAQTCVEPTLPFPSSIDCGGRAQYRPRHRQTRRV